MIKKYVLGFAALSLASSLGYGCSSDDNNNTTPANDAGNATDSKKDTGPKPDGGGDPGECAAVNPDGFAATKSLGVVAAHQNKCTAAQLNSFVKCMQDFAANDADCKAWGFDASKTLGTAFTGDCATCLFALPDKPNTALKVELYGSSAILGLNEVACLETFGGKACADAAQSAGDCVAEACNEDAGCTEDVEAADHGKCRSEAYGEAACKPYATTMLQCATATDGGPLSTDAGVVNALTDVCGKFSLFTGDNVPDDTTYTFANYLCGAP